MQLATTVVEEENDNAEPRCRTVVFRGFLTLPTDHPQYNECDNATCIMKMCTDSRSQKVAQTAVQPRAEIVWWFPKTSEQYRVRGALRLIGDQKDTALAIARKDMWGSLSDPARESFLGENVPGAAYEYKEESSNPPAGGRDKDGKVLPPPANFLLMLLEPTDVDYLLLRGEQYRQKDSLSKETGWSFHRVNP